MNMKSLRIVDGDLLDQDVAVIVNPWNRNILPWWLLLPQGVSGAIKRRGGIEPFQELGRMGAIPLGHAVVTTAGRLPFHAIIHVAGINGLWRSSERSVRDSVRNALTLATQHGYRSIAIPLIGAGSGGGDPETIQAMIAEEVEQSQYHGEVRLVRYLATPKPLFGSSPKFYSIAAAISIAGLAIAMLPRFFTYNLSWPPDLYPWIGGLLISIAGLMCLLAAVQGKTTLSVSHRRGQWIAFGLIALGICFCGLGVSGSESRRLAKLRRDNFLESMKKLKEVLESSNLPIGPSQSEFKKKAD
jgi:O-acetyl-ADP-ribose deacetylase (regulator of RNase III)